MLERLRGVLRAYNLGVLEGQVDGLGCDCHIHCEALLLIPGRCMSRPSQDHGAISWWSRSSISLKFPCRRNLDKPILVSTRGLARPKSDISSRCQFPNPNQESSYMTHVVD